MEKLFVDHGKLNNREFTSRICNVLDFARHNLELVAGVGYNNDDFPEVNLRSEKVITETALLLYVVHSCANDERIRERIDDIAVILIPHARSRKLFLELCLFPSLSLEFAQAHILLSKIGYIDSKTDFLLGQSVNAQSHFGRERPPHRILEQKWIREIWDDQSCVKENVEAFSILSHPMDLLNSTRDDMYAFTHALMYLTNFGNSAVELPRKKSEYIQEAEALLGCSLDEGDFDLAGEILLTWPMLGEPWSPLAEFAFEVLMQAEDQVGFLPSPGLQLEKLCKLDGDERRKYLFASSYHTAYVMGLLCSVSLRHAKFAQAEIQNPTSTQVLDHFFTNMVNDEPLWIKEFKKLGNSQQDKLAGFILNVHLVRSIRQKKFELTHELLRLGHEDDLTDNPLASQAAELLDRIASISQSVPA